MKVPTSIVLVANAEDYQLELDLEEGIAYQSDMGCPPEDYETIPPNLLTELKEAVQTLIQVPQDRVPTKKNFLSYYDLEITFDGAEEVYYEATKDLKNPQYNDQLETAVANLIQLVLNCNPEKLERMKSAPHWNLEVRFGTMLDEGIFYYFNSKTVMAFDFVGPKDVTFKQALPNEWIKQIQPLMEVLEDAIREYRTAMLIDTRAPTPLRFQDIESRVSFLRFLEPTSFAVFRTGRYGVSHYQISVEGSAWALLEENARAPLDKLVETAKNHYRTIMNGSKNNNAKDKN